MKLSEAVQLGMLCTDPAPFNIDTCGLGMAGNAVGIPGHSEKFDRRTALKRMWPWLEDGQMWRKWLHSHEQLVDEKDWEHWPSMVAKAVSLVSYWNFLASTYNYDVSQGVMTLEQWVRIIRSMEPDCGECNRFKCHCHDLLSNIPVVGIEVVQSTMPAAS